MVKKTIIIITATILLACGQASAMYSPELKAKAEQGDAAAQCELGLSYSKGDGVEQDEQEGVKWLIKAAEQGHADAQYWLGRRYLHGRLNVQEATKWFLKAAEQGHAGAQYWLGRCYQLGAGVEKDELKAVEWYRKAAEQRYKIAQQVLESLELRLKETEKLKQ